MKRVYINNVEYSIIFNTIGVNSDTLCSIFVHLRGSKNGKRRYEPKGKLKHYSLLKSETGLSRHTIEKYVPLLIELGLVRLNKDGGVTVIGFDTSFKTLRTTQSRKKYIPIDMHKSHIKTAVSVGAVRIKNSINNQIKYIDKKNTQTKLLKRHDFQIKNPHLNILSKAEFKAVGKILLKYGSKEKFLSTYCEEIILSHQGFANLNKFVDGRYFKKQLVDCGIIESKIRTEKLTKKISYKKFLSLKNTIISVNGKGIYWSPLDGCVHKYLSSSLSWSKISNVS
jgi:hypothetical protein